MLRNTNPPSIKSVLRNYTTRLVTLGLAEDAQSAEIALYCSGAVGAIVKLGQRVDEANGDAGCKKCGAGSGSGKKQIVAAAHG